MKNTQKYIKAKAVLTFSHNDQNELYQELNRLGWFWNAKNKDWERNDSLADPPMEGVRIRLWAESQELEENVDLITQILRENGYVLMEKSEPYLCRPPKQNQARVYLYVRRKDEPD